MLDFPGASVSAHGLADWIETAVLFGESGSLSRPALIDHLTEDSGLEGLAEYDASYDPDAEEDVRAPELSEEYIGLESLVDDAMQELGTRQAAVGASYPFVVSDTLVERQTENWASSPVYAFLCALNARYVYKLGADFHTASRLFEQLTVPALAAYWGGRSTHFGSPRAGEDPRQFGEALQRLAALMGERLSWEIDELPRHTGDMSVDVAAWRPVDQRRGQTVLLCQCAIGGDWASKGLELEVWRALISFAVAPSRALAFPFIAEALTDFNAFDWEVLCARVGVPFDRLRLAHLLAEASVDAELVEAIIGWTMGLADVFA
jgi:hypothetical protein